jgi:hypothetical protein
MLRLRGLLLLGVIGLLVLLPPGLCPCWLLQAGVHHHLEMVGHNAMDWCPFETSDASMPPAVAHIITPGKQLIGSLAQVNLWRSTLQAAPGDVGWRSLPESPPPRFSTSKSL